MPFGRGSVALARPTGTWLQTPVGWAIPNIRHFNPAPLPLIIFVTAFDEHALGEAVAISMLRDMRGTYNKPFNGFSLTKFDGTTITV